MTLVGTIQSNRSYLSKLVKLITEEMERFETVIYKSNDCMLTIYKTKSRKKLYYYVQSTNV